METGFRSLFLSVLLATATLYASSAIAQSAEADKTIDSVLIKPDIQRQEFDEALIDREDFELMAFAGFISIEDFGVNPLLALKLNYHVSEALFVQFTLAQSEGGKTSYEILSAGGAPLLTPAERELQYYSINVGFNLLPGEAFWSEQTAYNTTFYLSAGIGATEFAGSDRHTINYGAGYRFLLNDAISLNTEFRNNVFDIDVFGSNKSTNNLEFIIGLGWFF